MTAPVTTAPASQYPDIGATPQGLQGTPGAPGTPAYTVVRSLPTVLEVQPPQGVTFGPRGSYSGSAGSSVLCSLNVGGGLVAIVKSVQLQVNGVLPDSAINFALRTNQVPLAGWTNLGPDAANIPVWMSEYGPHETYIIVQGPKTLDLYVTVTDSGSYTVYGGFRGWLVPAALVTTLQALWR